MNSFKNRLPVKALAVAAAAALALSACGGGDDSASDSKDGTVKVAVFPSFNALGAHTADLEGTFEDQGLDVEFITVATPAEATPQLLGGKVDFALMDVTTPVIARSENVPVVMVAPGATGTAVGEDGMGVGNFWVAKDSKIKSIKDIENATFGVPQTKSQIWVDVRTVVDEAGGDSSKIKFVEVPNTIAALKGGSVDVVTTAEPSGTAALADSDIKLLSGYVAGGEGELAYTYVTSDSFAGSNPETVEKFAQAILEANKLLNTTEGLPAKIAETYIDAPAELLAKSRFQKFGEEPIDAETVEAGIARVLRYDLIDEDDAPSVESLLADK
ncbi:MULTISPECIES: ABC transporter substrate-binding protein [unclassified Nocardioides]|uniref:ABC transporter substrate-binding protein n=1 Tax=unclassified Nocardioides TaxID=2615069 RepID=UPI001885B25E|nr:MULTISPECIES: ABC transporter substrate-binding protein [unclassified Nocardioides]